MKKFKTQSWIVCLLVAFCLLFLPQFSKALTSQQIPLFTFSLSGGKGETLSGVAVNLDSTNAQAAITNGSITSLSLYKDDGSGQLNASLNNFIGSQSTVSIASTVTIPLSTTTEALGKFYLTMTTNGTWNGINPADSITVSTSLGKPFTISLGGNRPPVAVPTPTPTRTPTVSLLCQQSLETLQATNQTNQNIYNNAAENAQNTYGLAIIKAGTDYSQAAAQALDKKTESYANAALKFTQAQAEINNSLIIAKDAQIQANKKHKQPLRWL